MICPRKYLLLVFLTLAPCNSWADDAIPFRFCFEDKQLLPYYAGKGTQVATPPGGTIEHLQAALRAMPQLQLQLQRKPWLRCLQLLEQNKIDAVVATFTPARVYFAVFPMRADDTPDPSRALSHQASCLVQRQGDDVKSRQAQGLVYARPLGYAVPGYADNISVLPVESQQKAIELVLQGRVDATTTLCEVDKITVPVDLADGLQLVYPPLYEATGYLVFSKAFYQQHHDQASTLWLELIKHRDASRYLRYLQLEPLSPETMPPQHEN